MATGSRVARLRGRALQRFRWLVAAWLDDAFFALAEALDVDFLFECGAHEAGASTRFTRSGNRSALAIEANPHTYEAITILAQVRGVQTLNVGLGEEQTTATFFIPKYSASAGNASFLKKSGETYDEVEIPLTTLDSLSTSYAAESKGLALWVDVEGLAASVLKGSKSILASSRCKLVKVEVETKSYWSGQALADDVDALMQECGLTPVLRDFEYEGQHNVLYVRDSAVCGLDHTIMKQWALLSDLDLPAFPSTVWSATRTKARAAAHAMKARVMSGDTGPTLFHRAAAAMGSVSSARIVKKRMNRAAVRHGDEHPHSTQSRD
jgi:FkbM family methyltransferase